MVPSRHWPVALYVPNLIGYSRIALTVLAFAYHKSPWHFLTYYSLGFVLDAADGIAARRLHQSTLMGAQLDMVTDRCATAALLTLLAVTSSQLADTGDGDASTASWWKPPLFLALVMLDGYSHWMQMVAGAFAGKGSHKAASRGLLLRLYYTRPVLAFVCLLNEACLLAVYMMHWGDGVLTAAVLRPKVYDLIRIVFWTSMPVCVLKQVVSLWQIVSAHNTIIDSD